MQLTLTSPRPHNIVMTIAALHPKMIGLTSTHPVTLPSFGNAAIANATPNIITITYNAPLNEALNPDVSFFGITGNTVISTDVVGSTVILTCALSYSYGNVVYVNYYPLLSGVRLLGANGLYAAGYTNKPVANNILSTSVTVDNTVITVDSEIITMDQE